MCKHRSEQAKWPVGSLSRRTRWPVGPLACGWRGQLAGVGHWRAPCWLVEGPLAHEIGPLACGGARWLVGLLAYHGLDSLWRACSPSLACEMGLQTTSRALAGF